MRKNNFVGFEILTAVVVLTSCSPLKDNKYFEGTCSSIFRVEEQAKEDI
jgi:hypothetical protein